MALCVHLEYEGVPLSFLLDVVEVAHSHTGIHLAQAFAGVLNEFGIDGKVSIRLFCEIASHSLCAATVPWGHMR